MAECSKFFCQVCHIDCHFASRYQRHLRSAHHRQLEEMFNTEVPDSSQLDTSIARSTGSEQEDILRPADHVFPCNPGRDDSLVGTECIDVEEQAEVGTDQLSSEDEFDTNELEAMLSVVTEGNDYAPFKSKIHALAYMLVHSPRPMGEGNLKFVFFLMNQLDSAVPSLSSMKKFCLPGLEMPTQHHTPGGIPFYVNSAQDIVRMCIGNPQIASLVARYPTIPNDAVREIYQASRWLEDPRFFSPMVDTSVGHVFVHDFVQFQFQGAVTLGRVSRFLYKEGATGVHASIQCLHSEQNGAFIVGEEVIVPASSIMMLVQPPLVLRHLRADLVPSLLTREEYTAYTSPHHLKAVAASRPVLMLPLILYTDDTSGNQSKQWNKFDSWCLKLAGLPNSDNTDLQSILHLCSSNKVDCIEMAPPLVEELKSLECKGVETFDAALQGKVLVVAPVLCVICDNPRASEVTNNLGPSSKKFCRICMVDRDGDPTALGEPRSKVLTLEQMERIRSQRTAREKAILKTEYGVKVTPNAMLELPIDLHKSTPVETLHTILLGPYKYLLRSLIGRLTTAHKEEIQARLSSFDFSGLDYKLTYSLTKHFRSFVGRDFKALAQMALFLLGPYMTPQEKMVWLSLSKVFRIAYCQEFKVSSTDESQRICAEFVHAVKDSFPDFLKKVKIHLLLHLTQSMSDFGPTSAFNTERCESYNSLIRARNIFANRLAPSRDIANGFASLEHFRFICSGGSIDGSSKCGDGLIALYQSPAIQSYLNGTPSSTLLKFKMIYQPGSLRKVEETTTLLGNLSVRVKGMGSLTVNEIRQHPTFTLLLMSISTDTPALSASCVIGSKNRELVNVGSSVEFSTGPGEIDAGVLAACFRVDRENTRSSYCLVQLYEPMDSYGILVTNEFDCPLLSLTTLFRCIPSHSVMQTVSIIHECTPSCVFKHINTSTQVERETVVSQKLQFVHDYSNNMFSFNVYCMHSSNLFC